MSGTETGIDSASLLGWLTEQRDECARIVTSQRGRDRLKWLIDQAHFQAAINTIEQQQADIAALRPRVVAAHHELASLINDPDSPDFTPVMRYATDASSLRIAYWTLCDALKATDHD